MKIIHVYKYLLKAEEAVGTTEISEIHKKKLY